MKFTPDTFGVVYLKDWIKYTDGVNYLNVAGRMTLMTDTVDFGFKVRGTDSNWAIQIKGNNSRMVVLGCQIRAIEIRKELDLSSSKVVDTLILP